MQTVADPRVTRAHAVDVHVGRRVRARRKALRMSQITLAEKLDLTFQQVQKYERGSNRISASKLYEIAQVLDVPVAHFFEGYHAPEMQPLVRSPNAQVQEFLNSSEAIDLGIAFLGIQSTEQRQRVVALMRAMGDLG